MPIMDQMSDFIAAKRFLAVAAEHGHRADFAKEQVIIAREAAAEAKYQQTLAKNEYLKLRAKIIVDVARDRDIAFCSYGQHLTARKTIQSIKRFSSDYETEDGYNHSKKQIVTEYTICPTELDAMKLIMYIDYRGLWQGDQLGANPKSDHDRLLANSPLWLDLIAEECNIDLPVPG